MEKSEPSLVPQWLRSTGSVSGGGSSAHHFASSSSNSGFLDRSSSSNSRRSSNNGSAKNAYSSFRSHRDKDRERDKERLSSGVHWDHDDPLGTILTGRNESETLRRSHSMVTRKQSEVLPRRVAVDLKNGSNSNHANGSGLISVGSIGPKAVFEKDFPSLGSEDKQAGPDIGRVSSPGLSIAVQSLPVGSSALIGGEGWTSALAEVSTVIGGSNTGSLPTAQSVTAPLSGPASALAGLNMAEALTQAPPRTRAAPQLSVQTQRLEELAIKQSRQLIPVTPSMPKIAVLNSSDKSKPKTIARAGEMNVPSKNAQQPPSLLHSANQSLPDGHVKSDAPKSSHGKLFVLKPGWENGVSTLPKDVSSPTSNASRAANSQLAASPAVPSATLRGPHNPKYSAGERKSTSSNLISGFNLEKRPSLSQTQSRNDFFNHLKKKTSTNVSSVLPDSASIISPPSSEKLCEVNKVVCPPGSQWMKNGDELTSNGGTCEEVHKFSEEEAAFLRSLGWEENSGEDEGLTEEEINAFYQECIKLRPSLKVCRGMQQKLNDSKMTNLGGASS